MSYQTWHNYGYGICTDEINTNMERLQELIAMAPNFKKDFNEAVEEWKQGENIMPSLGDIDEILTDMDLFYGIASVLSVVIEEVEGIRLVACDDYNCLNYVMLPAWLPWDYNAKELKMTEESVEDLFRKYINILTDKQVTIDFQAVENGG